jgi:hypothetical protein
MEQKSCLVSNNLILDWGWLPDGSAADNVESTIDAILIEGCDDTLVFGNKIRMIDRAKIATARALTFIDSVRHPTVLSQNCRAAFNSFRDVGIGVFSSATGAGTTLRENVFSNVTTQYSGLATAAIPAGIYTPTLVLQTNVASASVGDVVFTRSEDVVHVHGSITITPTAAAGAYTELRLPLPIPSDLSGGAHLAAGTFNDAVNQFGRIYALVSAVSNQARFSYNANFATARTFSFHFSYRVV